MSIGDYSQSEHNFYFGEVTEDVEMETFEEWWQRVGLDSYMKDDDYKELAKSAFGAAKAQSRNYTTDDSVHPRFITFGNGRIVVIRERIDDPGRFYLGVGSTAETEEPRPNLDGRKDGK